MKYNCGTEFGICYTKEMYSEKNNIFQGDKEDDPYISQNDIIFNSQYFIKFNLLLITL